MAAATDIASEPVREPRALTMLRRPIVLRLTSSIGSAVLCGVVVGGVGGRVVMLGVATAWGLLQVAQDVRTIVG